MFRSMCSAKKVFVFCEFFLKDFIRKYECRRTASTADVYPLALLLALLGRIASTAGVCTLCNFGMLQNSKKHLRSVHIRSGMLLYYAIIMYIWFAPISAELILNAPKRQPLFIAELEAFYRKVTLFFSRVYSAKPRRNRSFIARWMFPFSTP